ncbi:MAG: insulinase family protein [Bacteroidota bacterium]
MLRALLSCSWLLLVTNLVWGQDFDLNQYLPLDTTVHQEVLPNGLRIFLQHHDEPRDRVALRLLVKAGSLQEENDQLGVAHFVEHMAFNGTAHFAKNTLVDFIERSGSRFGADLNASTSFSQTIYKLQVRSDSISLVDSALQIMADWAGAVSFDPEEVDKERGIIRSEWRSSLSSNQRLQLQTYEALLQGSRYLQRYPIGDPVLIDTVAQERLVAFYERWYQPANMALVVVGQVDMEWVRERVQELFTPLKNKSDFEPAKDYELTTAPRRSFQVASDEEAPFTRCEIVWQHKKETSGNTYKAVKHRYVQSIAERILNKRLAALKEDRLLPYTFGYSGFSGLPGNYETYRINAMCKPEEIFSAFSLLLQETKRAAIYGFTEAEIEEEKTSILERARQSVKELDKLPSSSRAGRIANAFLRARPLIDLQQTAITSERCLAAIEAQELQVAIQNGIQSNIQTAILSTNTSELTGLPDSLQLYTALDSILTLPVEAPKKKEVTGPLLVLPASTSNYSLVAVDTVLDISTYQLSNGVKVYLKPTDFNNDQIQFRAFSEGGIDLYANEDFPSARHGLGILNESGLDTFRESELLRILSGKQARLSPYMSTTEEGLSGASNQEDLETMLQLAYLYLTRPRFDSIVLATYLDRQQRIFERIDTDPRAAFGRMMIDQKYDYHPRRPNLSLAELDKIDLQRAEEIYRERFADIGDFQMIFVGNFVADSLLHLVDRYLGHLPTFGSEESWQDQGLRLRSHTIDTIVQLGQTPKAEINLTWHSNFNYADRNERLHHSVLREVLSIRLREVLREDMGGVYGVRVTGRYRAIPDSLQQFAISFNAEPAAYEELIEEIHSEIDRIAAGDIPDEIIPKIQANRLKSYEEALRRNSFWLGQIKQCLQLGLDWTLLYPGRYEERLTTINKTDLAVLAKKYLQEALLLKFVLLPE